MGWLLVDYSVEVQSMLFARHFLFQFYMTDFVRPIIRFHSPMRIDFWLIISVEVQLSLFVKDFLFFPPGTCRLHFREAV